MIKNTNELWFSTEEVKSLFPGLTQQRLHQLRESYRSDTPFPQRVDYNDNKRLIHGTDFVRVNYHKVFYSLSGVLKIKKRIRCTTKTNT